MPQEQDTNQRRVDPAALLAEGLSRVLQRTPSTEEITKFQRYLQLFLQWNKVHRLTAYRRPEEIVCRLLLDSLLFLKILPPKALKLLDFGSGAGIPGIPLKIVAPQFDLTLVEARRRRSSFLATALRELDLGNVRLIRGRAEHLLSEMPELRETFDAVVLRAVGPLEAILPTALSFLKPGKVCIASGPPAGKTIRVVFEGALAHWQRLTSPFSKSPRQFLVVQKIR